MANTLRSMGDRFIYYATKDGFENGRSTGEFVQAFIASGTIISHEPIAGSDGPSWVKNANYDPPFHIPIKPLLDELTFITNTKYWGMAFRRSLFEISRSDYERILQP